MSDENYNTKRDDSGATSSVQASCITAPHLPYRPTFLTVSTLQPSNVVLLTPTEPPEMTRRDQSTFTFGLEFRILPQGYCLTRAPDLPNDIDCDKNCIT